MVWYRIYHTHTQLSAGFIQTLESPGIKLLRFPGLESPGKGIGPGKPWKSSGILKYPVVVLEILISGTSIAN